MIPLPVLVDLGDGIAAGPITRTTDASIPPEGYRLDLEPTGIRITSSGAAGAFYAEQTLGQLGEHPPTGVIEDHPRFAYRGAMLDVARHFLPVEAVLRYVDDIALLKLNHLHLHLTDDQGWRIEIDAYPELTRIGGATQVGGGGGGYYTKADYRRIVAYAAERFVTIVPEIDMPGHTNAAIVAYPELGDEPAEPYEGIEVGFSTLAIGEESTYEFVRTVLTELAAMTPGPYLHLGGDESFKTSDEDFLLFVRRAAELGAATGKTVIGWHEMGRSSELPAGMVGQYWDYAVPREPAGEYTLSFVRQGGKVILSPADRVYLDIRYTEDHPYGLVWADGPTTLPDAYDWEPTDIVPGLAEADILGVEAPIWTETLATIEQVESMAFPRLAAVAERAWSPRGASGLLERLPALQAVWDARGIAYHRVPEVGWA